MGPDLELVQIRPGESFAVMAHGYPFRTVRWHFHPEFELHQIVETKGRYFVGDFIGEFEPGNLVLTGPNLPHNWVSDVPDGESVPLRCRFIQFDEDFIGRAIQTFPEMAAISTLLKLSRRGVLFSQSTRREIFPLLAEITHSHGLRRAALFMAIMDALSRETQPQLLASESYLPDPSGYLSTGMNRALAYIRENLTQPFSESDLAAIAHQTLERFLTLVPQAYGHVAPPVHPAAAHQLGLPDAHERRAGADFRHLLRGRLQQSVQLQPAVSRGEKHAAVAVQTARHGQSSRQRTRLNGRTFDRHLNQAGARLQNRPKTILLQTFMEETQMVQYSSKLTGAAVLAIAVATSGGTIARAADISGSTVAFLMPDQGSTRYEEHDHPGFVAEMKKVCESCKVIYLNADTDAAKQQQQFNSVIAQGAKVIVLDPVDSSAAASLVHNAQSQGVKVIAYDRPIPDAKADFYVSFNNQAIGKAIAASFVELLKSKGVSADGDVGRPPDQRLADRRSRGTDQEGNPRGTGHRPVQDARRIRHAELAADQCPAMGGRTDRALWRQDRRRRRGE